MRRNAHNSRPRLVVDGPEGPRLVSLRRRYLSGGGLIAVAALAMAAGLLLVNGAARQDATVQAAQAGPDTGQILVKFKPGASQQAIDALNAANGAQQVDQIAAIGVKVLKLPAGQTAQAAAAVYAHNPLVQFAEANTLKKALDTTPNDPQFTGGNQWGLQKVKGPAAWDITTGSSAAVIAVLDTGTWGGHPDLTGKVIGGYNAITGTANAADDNGHGTWVSGVAGADTNNGAGMAGMSWGSPVMPVKVCDASGGCYDSDIARGMTWAADHGAKVINLSLGGGGPCGSTLQSATDYAWSRGVVIVAASGNEGAAVDAPANCNNVVAVGATDSTDTRTSWSNYGSGLDLVAPGSTILCLSLSGGYGWCTGTSFSSPFVSGAAALLLSKGATNSAAVSALTAGADDLGTAGWDQYYGAGRLNAYKALLALTGSPTSTPTPATTTTPAPTAISTPVSSPTVAPTATSTSSPVASPTSSPTSAPAPVAGDTSAPTVSLTNPGQGQTLKGNVTFSASASDNVGVVRVEFYVDGALYRTDTSGPYTAGWNSRKVSNGSHTVTARAYDAAGNRSENAHTVTVSN